MSDVTGNGIVPVVMGKPLPVSLIGLRRIAGQRQMLLDICETCTQFYVKMLKKKNATAKDLGL